MKNNQLKIGLTIFGTYYNQNEKSLVTVSLRPLSSLLSFLHSLLLIHLSPFKIKRATQEEKR